MEKIRWAPKVRQEKLWQLYQSDAQGLLDEDLAAEVGYALLARCESITLIDVGLRPARAAGRSFWCGPFSPGAARNPCRAPRRAAAGR